MMLFMESETLGVAAFIGLLVLILMAATDDYKEAKEQEKLYCSMVHRHLESAGQFGWPDYKGVYGEVCVGE